MPVPYAKYNSEDDTTNLQLFFWRAAVEHFDAIKLNISQYAQEADFDVDACLAIVLAGTSVSQLLGQQQTAPKSSSRM